MMGTPLPWQYNDGGRAAAGYRGDAGDCVTRAIAIATGRPYQAVYDDLRAAAGKTPRNGVRRKAYDQVLATYGYTWHPCMRIGSGCQVHMAVGELPPGRLVVRLSGHVCAVVDGVAHDTYDPCRGGTRCVYGYWQGP